MTDWNSNDLATIDQAQEIRIASRRADGSLSPDVIIWAVVAEGAVYVRSAYGAGNGWYQRAVSRGAGRVSAGGVEQAVTFTQEVGSQTAIDDAYASKYVHYPSIVAGMVGEKVWGVTLRADPVD